jgi:uncharacterized protein
MIQQFTCILAGLTGSQARPGNPAALQAPPAESLNMIPTGDLPLFTLIVSVGILTQSATGFAAGLLIIPLMVWAGYGIPEGQAALLVSSLPQTLWGFYRYREAVTYRELALPAALRLGALPVGVATLFMIDHFPKGIIQQGIGMLVIFFVIAFAIIRPRPQTHLHPGWTWLAFLSSGFFQGCTGTGGPMMVFWVQAHDWSTKRTRAFLFMMYLVTAIPAWSLLYYCFSSRVLGPSLASILAAPALLLATALGLRLGTWLGRNRLKRVTMALLLVIGITSIASPWIVYWSK